MRMAYKCRAYPDPGQTVVLNRTFGCVRKVWNDVLDWRTKRYRAQGVTTTYAESDRYLTQLKKTGELAFLNEVSSVPLQQTLRHQSRAFAGYFAKRTRHPRFKSRTGKQSATYTRSAFRMREGELYLAKMAGSLRHIWSWPDIDPVTLNPTTVTVSREPDGMWYVSFVIDTDAPGALPLTDEHVGIDLGVIDLAVTSDGDRVANPRHLERKQLNLARYQRRMARKCKGSANRRKAARKVAAAHGKVRRTREDFLHKTTTSFVRRYDVIVVEDLNVAGMVRNRSLARAISGCGWGTFRAMLEYKTARWGRRLVVIDRWYPSSKLCSACGHLLARLALDTRHWTCPDCGTLHDRDINAAKNILAEGLSVSACGADVRHSETSRVRSATKQENLRCEP
ncbi:transposase [Actinomadura darangshiensis]|uniref:Transposase n=1 Tax=Actinomadura darangshiensis TaxID=705336 RepID=A0A4R5A1R3_9ACTN|nr:RNA-guided endonuclease TnpB family protein [Actinomadura darangshiensis]TDD65818.1 transposase [Actinomadura darangshiensis]